MSRRSRVYVPIIRRSFDQRFRLARLTRKGGFGDIVGNLVLQGDDMVVLPRNNSVRRSEIKVDIEAQPQSVPLPSEIVEHFVRKASHRFIMDFCICRSSDSCRDYPIGLGCLFLGPGTERIDPGLGRMATIDEALDHLRRCREAGLVHLIGRNKLDSMWLGTGKKEDLMTICNCCPCCCLWKMLPDLRPDLGSAVTRMPGVSVRLDADRCNGCGSCAKGGCFVDAISIKEGKATIDQERCRGCGRCVEACPRKAIAVEIDDDRAIEAAISRLTPLVRL